jgi:O-antigen/teichoic acid export membrane protein
MERQKKIGVLRWSYILAWSNQGISIAAMFILARVLGPEAFGIVTIAMIFISLIEMLVDSGMALAIVQRSEIKEQDLHSIFWLNFFISIFLTAICYFAARKYGSISSNPQEANIFMALCPLILFKGLTVVQYGLAQRSQNFKALAMRGAGASMVGGLSGIIAAIVGAGVWSLVFQHLVTGFFSLLLLWRVSEWRPEFRFSLHRIKPFVKFSLGVLISQIGSFTSRNADVLLMKVFFGDAAVGIMRLAMRLISLAIDLIVRPVQMVALSTLAANQGDRDSFNQQQIRLIRQSSMLMLPAMMVMVLSADLLSEVLGAKWGAAETAIQILSLIGVSRALTLLSGPSLLAMGRSNAVAAGNWVQGGLMVGIIALVGWFSKNLNLDSQIIAIAGAKTACTVLIIVPIQTAFLVRLSGLHMKEIISAMTPAIKISIGTLAGGTTIYCILYAFGQPAVIRNVAMAVTGSTLAFLFLFDARRRGQLELLR